MPTRVYRCRVCGQGEEREEVWDDPGPRCCPYCQANLDDLKRLAGERPIEAAKLVGKHKPEDVPAVAAAAWVGVARAVLNLDEFVTRE